MVSARQKERVCLVGNDPSRPSICQLHSSKGAADGRRYGAGIAVGRQWLSLCGRSSIVAGINCNSKIGCFAGGNRYQMFLGKFADNVECWFDNPIVSWSEINAEDAMSVCSHRPGNLTSHRQDGDFCCGNWIRWAGCAGCRWGAARHNMDRQHAGIAVGRRWRAL